MSETQQEATPVQVNHNPTTSQYIAALVQRIKAELGEI